MRISCLVLFQHYREIINNNSKYAKANNNNNKAIKPD